VRNAIAIAKKELYLYFTTPIAYVVFFATSFIGAFFFLSLTSDFQRRSLQFMQFQALDVLDRMNLTDMVATPLVLNMGVILIFVVPFLTMRLLAEERRQKTMELLMTAPVRSGEIVLGKYLAALGVLVVVIGITAVFPALLDSYGTNGKGGSAVEWQTVFAALGGLFLCGAAFVAVGLFVSALTESQVVAALITFLVLLLTWVVGWKAADAEGVWRDVIGHLSSVSHLVSFARGVIELKDVVYFLSLAVIGLFLTHRAVEARRWA
jgi:ABC-2 type transport system permease protein